MWKWLEQYFTFTQGEKKGILFLVFLSVVVFIAPKAYLYFSPIEQSDTSVYDREVEAFIKEYEEKRQLALADTSDDSDNVTFNPYRNVEVSSHFKTKRQVEYFDFDPNKIGVKEWIKLGFTGKQAESIERAKEKGWKFYKPEDLKKIYVVGEENYNRLAPYIKIDPKSFPEKKYAKAVYPERPNQYVVDINTADSSQFERLKGLGPSLASRIIKYRIKLGGFVSPEQLKEVWGLPDSVYQNLNDRFVVNGKPIDKINLNSADFETLRKHPYISYSYAKIIKAYRQQHGNFKTTEDLKKIPVMTDSIFTRLEPYITVGRE
jgi:competence protein ComEA